MSSGFSSFSSFFGFSFGRFSFGRCYFGFSFWWFSASFVTAVEQSVVSAGAASESTTHESRARRRDACTEQFVTEHDVFEIVLLQEERVLWQNVHDAFKAVLLFLVLVKIYNMIRDNYNKWFSIFKSYSGAPPGGRGVIALNCPIGVQCENSCAHNRY